MVRVWFGEDRDTQHFTEAPSDDVVRTWEGTTMCGLEGQLHYVHGEHVDSGDICETCFATAGTTRPSLTGQAMNQAQR